MIGSGHFQHLMSFYVPWATSVTVAAVGEPGAASDSALAIQFDGLSIPAVQLALAVGGVLLARPLAPKSERAVGWFRFALVTLIMMIVAAAWVAQSRPGMLFAFVVSIGLGFSGYSLIELAGAEAENFIRRIFGAASSAVEDEGGGDMGGNK